MINEHLCRLSILGTLFWLSLQPLISNWNGEDGGDGDSTPPAGSRLDSAGACGIVSDTETNPLESLKASIGSFKASRGTRSGKTDSEDGLSQDGFSERQELLLRFELEGFVTASRRFEVSSAQKAIEVLTRGTRKAALRPVVPGLLDYGRSSEDPIGGLCHRSERSPAA